MRQIHLRHLTLVSAGLAWTTVAMMLCSFFGLTEEDILFVMPSFTFAGIVTSYAVTWLFRAQLFGPEVRGKYWLPVLTIATAVPIWSILVFTVSAITSMILGRHDLFDGFGLFVVFGLLLSLTLALPLTYPVAYLTQVVISRHARPGCVPATVHRVS